MKEGLNNAMFGWRRVVFASDLEACKMCGEPWCDIHDMHYADCECIGPTQDGYEYKEIRGILFAREVI